MSYFLTRPLVTDSLAMMNEIIATMTDSDDTEWFTKVAERNTATEQHILLESKSVDAYLEDFPEQKFYVLFKMAKAVPDTALTGVPFNEIRIVVGTPISWTGTTPADTVFQTGSNTQEFLVFNAANRPAAASASTFVLSITDRGFVLAYWKNINHNTKNANFIIDVQRPVNPSTGVVNTDGLAPIFFLGRSMASTSPTFTWGLIRDKSRSNTVVYGTTDVPNRNLLSRVSMEWPWPVTFDTNRHVVKFVSGFATPSALYMDEMDLICLVNSMSFFYPSNIKITMYGEASEREYFATFGDLSFGLVTGVVTETRPSTVANARIGILRPADAPEIDP